MYKDISQYSIYMINSSMINISLEKCMTKIKNKDIISFLRDNFPFLNTELEVVCSLPGLRKVNMLSST